MDYNALTERIMQICRRLDNVTYVSAQDKEKIEKELKSLVEQRAKLLETLKKNKEQ